jgi:hypothetical protein
MPTTQTSPAPVIFEPVRTSSHPRRDTAAPQFTARTTPSSRFTRDPVVETSRLIQVYISGTSGLGVQGLLKSISRGGLQVLTPIPVPVRSAVLITIAGCCTVPAEVFYCIKKSTCFQVGIVFSTRHKPEIAVGAFAVIHEIEEPFTVSRGHVMDIGSSSLSIMCKTKLTPNTWVRVESNGWVIFGEVEGVVPSSMVASCVGIHLDAAFRAQFSGPDSLPAPSEEMEGVFEGAKNA